jgi:hypothetical protein
MGEKVHEIAKELKIENFTVSDKWMFNFFRRHNLTPLSWTFEL